MTICIESPAHLTAVMDDLERLWFAQHSGDEGAAGAAEWLDHLCEGQQFPLLLDLTHLPADITDALAIALANTKEST